MGNPGGLVRHLQKRLENSGIAPFELILADGTRYSFGRQGGNDAHDIVFRLHFRDAEAMRAMASMDEYVIATAYLDGHIDVSGDFMSVLDLRKVFSDSHPLLSVWRFLRPWLVGQVKADKTLVPRHYDHGNEFYFSFLDKKFRLYSQALYNSEEESLEQAAANKMEYIRRICRLERGSHVLDVGAGWGSFSGYAAANGVDVTMLTISHEQYKYLTEWSKNQDTPARLRTVKESIFAYDPSEQYDAVVILGVMEHLPNYSGLFARLEKLLKPNGRVYMDFVATRKKYDVATFTYQHVFKGNHSPVIMHELMAAANQCSFEVIVIHNDRHSYCLTLQAWARNLEAAHDDVARRFGEWTYRLFQTYLWGGAHNLNREGDLESYRVVFQRSMGQPSSAIGVYQAI